MVCSTDRLLEHVLVFQSLRRELSWTRNASFSIAAMKEYKYLSCQSSFFGRVKNYIKPVALALWVGLPIKEQQTKQTRTENTRMIVPQLVRLTFFFKCRTAQSGFAHTLTSTTLPKTINTHQKPVSTLMWTNKYVPKLVNMLWRGLQTAGCHWF